ncbi:hypothetical protein Aph01nite_12870 [Acrocarpospora phusangensis]|uniref:Helix-turn-helix domain-containing protein n=1 Tax=Acrocarpospora phusangensis TaxID=1070424 RepID=A0A919QAV0_9ACTN|nr:helix-turn-helix domain-containing protein [Acrocarpospora phusangensis]GIH22977.1 hypothetical protein Aph01nite_12870 [Acrocarpospora phusangensis]
MSASTEIQVTTREAATALGVSVRTIQRHAKQGKLNAAKANGRWVITLTIADEYKPAQVAKALELVEQAAIIPTSSNGAFAAIGSDGETWYPVTVHTCGCKAGLSGRNCYHRLAAHLKTRATYGSAA